MGKSRLESFVGYASRRGVWKALYVLCQFGIFKLRLAKSINIPGYGSLFLRRNSTDLTTLRQIFVDEEYFFQIKPPKIIIDLGANIGLTARYFAKRYPDTLVIALEPDSGNFEMLIKNTVDLNIVKIKKAIWDETTDLYLDIDPNLGEWGIKVTNEQTQHLVQTTTLNDIIENNHIEIIDLLKIDIETAEERLFKHPDWLTKVRYLVIETHDRMKPYSSNNFFRSISQLHKFNVHLNGENIIVENSDLA